MLSQSPCEQGRQTPRRWVIALMPSVDQTVAFAAAVGAAAPRGCLGLWRKVCWTRSCCRGVPLCGSLSSRGAKETLPSQNGGGTFCFVTGCSGGRLSTLEYANPAGMYMSCLGAIIGFLFVCYLFPPVLEKACCVKDATLWRLHCTPVLSLCSKHFLERRAALALNVKWQESPVLGSRYKQPESHGTFGSAELAGLPQNLNGHVWFQFWKLASALSNVIIKWIAFGERCWNCFCCEVRLYFCRKPPSLWI